MRKDADWTRRHPTSVSFFRKRNSRLVRRRRIAAAEPLEGRVLLAGDLVAHWLADALNSSVADGAAIGAWTDSVGGLAATASGSPTLAKGALSGRSLVEFDPSDGKDYFLVLGKDSVMSHAEDFTVAVAFMTSSTALVGGTGDWYQNTGLVDSNRLNFGRGWGVSLNANGQASAGMGAGFFEPVTSVYSSESALNDGKLHVVTFTRRGSTLSLYVDGGTPVTSNLADDAARDQVDMLFGVLEHKENPYTGLIAEVRVYDGALTAAEVDSLAQTVQAFYDNEAPTAAHDTYNLVEDPAFGFVTIPAAQGVLSNDSDPESDPLSAVIVEPPQYVDVTLSDNGSLNIILPANFAGTDTFTYTARDGQASNVATVTLNVANVYDPAVAVNDRYKLTPSQTLNLSAAQGVLANDQNPDGAALQAVRHSDVAHGQLTLNADGSLAFDPQGQAGEVTFSYRINDQTQLSPPATVTLVVNTPPVAANDTLVVNEDIKLVRTGAAGILANDVDGDQHSLTVALVDGPDHGTLTLAADGSLEYQPDANYYGTDQFTYRLHDGEDDSNVATVTLNVESVNDAPTAVADVYYTGMNQSLTVPTAGGVLANDTDVEGSVLTAVLVQGPSSGNVQLAGDGSLTYTPNAGFAGTDTFTYRSSDGQGQSQPTTVSVLVGTPPVRINELMAANATTLETRLRDDPGTSFRGDRSTPDWIELANLTTSELDLSGFHLTDDEDDPKRFALPPGTKIPAGGYLIVFADGENVRDSALDELGYLHANFKLDVLGEYLAVTSPTGSVIHQYTPYPEQRADIAYGIKPDGSTGHLLSATPGAANVGAYAGLVPDTSINVPRGVYETSFNVTVSNPDPQAVIRYTTDGSQPTLTNGQTYSGAVAVTGTTVLKAAAFRDGYIPSPVAAQSYIFPAQVLQQDNTGLAGSLNWGHAGPDWAMDPNIVNHEDPEVRPVAEDLLRLPTVSLAIDTDLFFGQSDLGRGIYIAGENVERPVTFEYFDPNTPGASVQTNSTIQIVGGSSPERWKVDKLSMRVRFTEDAGDSELNYPLFGTEAASAFDTLVVDARLNNVWHYGGGSEPDGQRARAQYMRDEFAADLQNAIGGYAPHLQHVHVYINGIYWGMHILHERPDENFNATYQGGVPEEYNVIKHTAGDVVSGTNDSYMELMGIIGRGNDPMTDEAYQAASQLLDVDDFIDYLLVNLYGGNQDWDHHNWYASQNPVDGKWRFHSWDAEKVLTNLNDNATSLNNQNAPTGMHRRLMTHPEYQLRFADRVQRHFYHDGAMTPEAAAKLYKDRSDQIDLVMRVESARWGDNQIDQGRRVRYTRPHWVENRRKLLEDYFPRRTEVVLGQFENRGWFQEGQAPEFSVGGSAQHGGAVTPGSLLTMTAPEGTVYYTTTGTDPRLPGGDPAPAANAYSSPLPLNAGVTILARMRRNDGSWGPLSEARFTTGVPADATNLRISEIHYHPADPSAAEEAAGFADADEFEFIELVNISATPVDLSQVRFEQYANGGEVAGIGFAFGDGSVRELSPGQRVVVVEDLEAFRVRYGSQPLVAGQWTGGLGNSSERVMLLGPGGTIADFSYSDRWHATTDGRGPSLQLVDESGDPAQQGTAGAWRASQVTGGTPGRSEGSLPGDSNRDGIFNSSDLVQVLAAGKYEVPGAAASFEEGDWNGDGYFTTADLVLALQEGNYVAAAEMQRVAAAEMAAASLFDDLNRRPPTAVGALDEMQAESLAESELDVAFAEWGKPGTLANRWLPLP